MITSMLLKRRLAGMIWAAMFVIAAQFFAGSALAHAGHSHGHPPASHISSVQNSDHVSPPILSPAQVAGVEQADVSLTAPEGAGTPVFPQSGACTGGCCGNGIGCCGAVLAVAPSPIPDERPEKETCSLALDRPSGIHPEALRRPPRTLA